MNTRRKLKPTADDGAALIAQLERLTESNRRLQDELDARLVAEQAWRDERRLLRAMIDTVPDYLFVKDRDSRFVVANRAVAGDIAEGPDSIIGKNDFELHPRERAEKFFADEQKIMVTGEPLIDIEEFIIERSGARKYLSTSKLPLRNDAGEVIGLVGIARDVTRRREAEDEVRFLAHHDSLTRLPNRSLLTDRLSQAILQAERDKLGVTVVFVDLDNFKLVNDSLGHGAGDLLLKTVAERMVKCVRSTDTVVRLGGDEFVIVLADHRASTVSVAAILDKLRDAIAAPMPCEGQTLHVTCSIGLATYPQDGHDAETLLRNADAAMYQAKSDGRDNFKYFTESMNTEVHERLTLQLELREALANGEFMLHFQPQVDLRTGKVFAAEALVRWNHPVRGLLGPDKFIGPAEESGFIVQLGEWVLINACRQNKAWQDAGLPPISVSVNVSARQFRDKTWIDRVRHALAATGLDAKYLELELTESLIMQDIDSAVSIMRQLQAIGVQFAIDDFGTGYSSLSALKSFPVGRLKIDRSFVRNLPDDAEDRGIATAVISLGQKLNMKVIAEGVETLAQMAFLTDNRCDEIQGYQFSRPVESGTIATLLKAQSLVSPAA